MNSELEWQET